MPTLILQMKVQIFMSNDISVYYDDSLNQKWLEINLPNNKNELAILTILNNLGEHILRMNLSGSVHKIQLTFLKLETCTVKIETQTSVVLKKIF